MKPITKGLIAALLGLLCQACATTQVDTQGDPSVLCGPLSSEQSVLLLWHADWRADQKEPAQREAIAARAIWQFFEQSSCYGTVTVSDALHRQAVSSLSDQQLLRQVTGSTTSYDKVIRLVVHELGPVLALSTSLSPVRGGTEVVLQSRLLDVTSNTLEAELLSHWRHGGAFVVKGTGTLERDMQAALATIFSPANRAEKE